MVIRSRLVDRSGTASYKEEKQAMQEMETETIKFSFFFLRS